LSLIISPRIKFIKEGLIFARDRVYACAIEMNAVVKYVFYFDSYI